MEKKIDHITLKNKRGEVLTIYKMDGVDDKFCIGVEDGEHFSFSASEAADITTAINQVVDGE